MNIAFVYDALYPEVKGGVERRLYELGKRLARRHEVHWYTFGWWGGEKTVEREGMVIHNVGKPKKLYRGGIRDPLEALAFSLRVSIEDFKYHDVIDVQEFPYLPAYPARIKLSESSKLVVTWHEYWGFYWNEYSPFFSPLGRRVEDGLLSLTDYHVVVSRHTLRRLINVDRASFKVIPNGIDIDLIHSIPSKKGVEYDFIFMGRITSHKNLQLLLKATALLLGEIPSLRVGIIGEGPDLLRMRELSIKLGLERHVDFLGFLKDFRDVIALLKSSRVFAFPSLREGFGISVMEANAAGVPAVVVNSPLNAAVELIVPGVNGYVSEATPRDFAEKLLWAWNDYPRLRLGARRVSSRYGWDNIARKVEKYYEGVINE